MKIRLVLAAATLVAAPLAVGACHSPGSAWNECYANRPHTAAPSAGGDDMSGSAAATFSFGVYSCRVRHANSSTYHTFCMYDDAHTKFACTGPQPAAPLDRLFDQVSKVAP